MDRNYNGLKYDMMIEWENGETTSKPPVLIVTDNPVTCAFYAAENNLLELNESLTYRGLMNDVMIEWKNGETISSKPPTLHATETQLLISWQADW